HHQAQQPDEPATQLDAGKQFGDGIAEIADRIERKIVFRSGAQTVNSPQCSAQLILQSFCGNTRNSLYHKSGSGIAFFKQGFEETVGQDQAVVEIPATDQKAFPLLLNNAD